ncbi:MAG: hypothetical protein FWC21_00410 [Treponema sp.]|nr:hypothetical protein [Treponema sp.]
MVGEKAIFKYKTTKGPLHKIPAIIKLILLLPLSILCLYLQTIWLLTGIFIIIFAAFFCGLSVYDQLLDFKPAAFYVIILFAFSSLSNAIDYITLAPSHSSTETPIPVLILALSSIFVPDQDYIRLALRLILIIQISALVFRTTSSLEIKYAARLDILTLFIGFIPDIFKIWSNINTAWKARNGKNNFWKIMNLAFILITICFENAAVKAKALEARRNNV